MLFQLLRIRLKDSNSIRQVMGLHFKVIPLSVQFLSPLFFTHSTIFLSPGLTEAQRTQKLKETACEKYSRAVITVVHLIPKTTQG